MSNSFSLEKLARETGGVVRGSGALKISGVAPLDRAKPGDLTFLTNQRYAKETRGTQASAILCERELPGVSKPFLLCANPYAALARIMGLFYAPVRPQAGIQPGAWVDASAKVNPQASVAPGATLSKGAKVGARSVLFPGVFLGENAIIGEDCLIYPNVTIRENCRLGDRVILQPGVVLGADGFGFAKDEKGYLKIPQVGNVVLEDDVEIGANSCVDRAAFGTTLIRRGTKLDNLVQIGHNVTVGEHTVMAALTGIAGSTHIGSHVVMAGQTGVAGHLKVADGVILATRAAVLQDISDSGVYWGTPAVEMALELRNSSAYRKLPELVKKVRELEKALKKLQGGKKR